MSSYPHPCVVCGRPNTVSKIGNSCGRTTCNTVRSVNKNIVQPIAQGVAQGARHGLTRK